MLQILAGKAIASTRTQFSLSVQDWYMVAHMFVDYCDLITSSFRERLLSLQFEAQASW